MFNYLIYAAFAAFVYMTMAFIVALIRRDNSIVDILWGPGFILLALSTILTRESVSPKAIILLFLTSLWAIRLAIYIYRRNHGKREDFRYAAWRQTWKYFILRSYFQVFMLQGTLMLIIAWPVLHAVSMPSDPGIVDFAGCIVFFAGFLIETIADHQMAVFKSSPDNKGKLLINGLWKYSRHPNYLGEAILWWGFWLMAVSCVDGIYTIISPIIITLLLRYVSGVPMLEKKYEGRPDWEEYKRITPVFWPFRLS